MYIKMILDHRIALEQTASNYVMTGHNEPTWKMAPLGSKTRFGSRKNMIGWEFFVLGKGCTLHTLCILLITHSAAVATFLVAIIDLRWKMLEIGPSTVDVQYEIKFRLWMATSRSETKQNGIALFRKKKNNICRVFSVQHFTHWHCQLMRFHSSTSLN